MKFANDQELNQLTGLRFLVFNFVHLPIINLFKIHTPGFSGMVIMVITWLFSICVALTVHLAFDRWAENKLKKIAKGL